MSSLPQVNEFVSKLNNDDPVYTSLVLAATCPPDREEHFANAAAPRVVEAFDTAFPDFRASFAIPDGGTLLHWVLPAFKTQHLPTDARPAAAAAAAAAVSAPPPPPAAAAAADVPDAAVASSASEEVESPAVALPGGFAAPPAPAATVDQESEAKTSPQESDGSRDATIKLNDHVLKLVAIAETGDQEQLASALSALVDDGGDLAQTTAIFTLCSKLNEVWPTQREITDINANLRLQHAAMGFFSHIGSFSKIGGTLLVASTLMPLVILFLHSPLETVVQSAALLIGETVGGDSHVRDKVLGHDVLPPLAHIAHEFLNSSDGTYRQLATLENVVYALAQLARNKPCPALSLFEDAGVIALLPQLLAYASPLSQEHALWLLCYLTDGPPARIETVMQYRAAEGAPRVFDMFLHLLRRCQRSSHILPVLRSAGNITATSPDNVDKWLVETGVVHSLGRLYRSWPKSQHAEVWTRQARKELFWLLSNVCAGYDTQVTTVFESNFLSVILEATATCQEFEVRREAAWCVANMTASGTAQRFDILLRAGAVPALCGPLSTQDSRICNICLESLESILLYCESSATAEKPNAAAEQVRATEGALEHIRKLRDHVCHTVFVRSAAILDTYFVGEWYGDA